MKDTEEKLINVEVDLSDETILKLALLAHDRDITLNQMCNALLKDYIQEHERN